LLRPEAGFSYDFAAFFDLAAFAALALDNVAGTPAPPEAALGSAAVAAFGSAIAPALGSSLPVSVVSAVALPGAMV